MEYWKHTAIILIFQLSANLANRIRIEFELKSNRIITNTNLNSNYH
jgi:hypothetical protein